MKQSKTKSSTEKSFGKELTFASTLFRSIEGEIGKVFIGQKEILRQVVVTLLSEGHLLLSGVPGLAKTLLVKTLAEVFNFSYNRIQFTPDLLPSDLIGYELLNAEKGKKQGLKFIAGPIFSQLLLADEINRAPAKTQSALLQAMEEKRATVLGKEHLLPKPFLVLATQNPIEEKGTYELPEAQLDRFMALLNIDYPSYEEEVQLVSLSLKRKNQTLKPILSAKRYEKVREEIAAVEIVKEAVEWLVRLVRATRPEASNNKKVKQYLRVGASPRAAKSLMEAARTTAYLNKNRYVEKAHFEFALPMIMRHRLKLSYEAEIDKVNLEELLKEVVAETKS